jgi:hypothetical protein
MSRSQHLVHIALGALAIVFLAKPGWNPWPELGKAVGEAFLIALLVIYLVEIHSHQRLEDTAEEIIRKIGKNIIPLIYGHELPPALVEALESNTLKQPVYRDKVHLDIELTSANLPRSRTSIHGADSAKETLEYAEAAAETAADMNEKLCKLANTYSYTLINCSDEAFTDTLRVALEWDKWLAEIIADGKSNPSLEYVKVGGILYVEADDKAKVLSKLSLPETTVVKDLHSMIRGTPDGSLLFEETAFSIPPKGQVDISFHGVMYKRYSDNEVWSTFYPTLEVTLSVSSVEFDVEARFPDSGDMLRTNQGDMTNRWVYDAPLLTGQSVIFWWRPKAAKASA